MACRPLCAYCRQRPMESPWAPFCSQRCKDVDLGRWLRGDYRITGDSQEPDERAPGHAENRGPVETDEG